MIKAACMNAVRNPTAEQDGHAWVPCGWIGEVASLERDECPKCFRLGNLAPLVVVPVPTKTKDCCGGCK